MANYPDSSNRHSDNGAPSAPDGSELVETLQEENDSLRAIIAELRQMLEEGGGKEGGGAFEEREREYESLLEEKSELIRTLHIRIQELEGQASKGPVAPPTPDQTELLALSDELERERCQLEQERRQLEMDRMQLREDEEAMMRQMREMELQMAKERAELARQRNELQRLHSEIRHELELAQRDAAVNERLKLLQRRHRETEEGGGGDSPSKRGKTPTPRPAKEKDSGSGGFIRRLFGGDK